MAHTIEPAASGRAKCRGCGGPIGKGDLRLGARHPSPFDEEKEVTLWFHLLCGVFTRPGPFLEAAAETSAVGDIPDREALGEQAKLGLGHPRLTRLRGAERARTGRAACRDCREGIPKDTWRLALVYYDEVEGRFSPGGFLHVKCAKAYFETGEILERVRHFTPALAAADLDVIASEIG